jgi:hypothetical protein
MFEETIKQTPTRRVDVVIANAGISGQDPVFVEDGMYSMIAIILTRLRIHTDNNACHRV